MKIERIDLSLFRMNLKTGFETSFTRISSKEFFVVSVYGEGVIGYGECVALPSPMYNEETIGSAWKMVTDFLIPIVLNRQIDHPIEIHDLFASIRRNYMAKSALETAIWDLYSKQQGKPLATVLGGTKPMIDVGVSIGIEPSVNEVLHKVEQFLSEGYKKIKVKIKPGFDLEPIQQIRKHFGTDIPLMADANSAYTLAHLDLLQELDQYQLMMIEQPLAHDDIVDHARLQRVMKTPICLDESIHSYEDARKAIELGSCRTINIKVGRVGGLYESKRIHDLCLEKDIPVWCGGMMESGIGRAHNIALTSLENFTIPGDTSASSRYFEEDIVDPEVSLYAPGVLKVPSEPGIGYQINTKTWMKFLRKQEVFQS